MSISNMLFLCHILSFTAGTSVKYRNREKWSTIRTYKSGDYIIGGIFPVHLSVSSDRKRCVTKNYRGLTWAQTMIYAINTINADSNILPSLVLGYDIRDDCNQVERALEIAYEFALGTSVTSCDVMRSTNMTVFNADSVSNNGSSTRVYLQHIGADESEECIEIGKDPKVMAVIGGASSTVSMVIANVLGVQWIPQISYSSSSKQLSDKRSYRSFFRTIPSDTFQVRAMVDIVAYFNWTYLAAIASDTIYGRLGVEDFQQIARRRNLCISRVELFSSSDQIAQIVSTLKNNESAKKAKVIVGFMEASQAKILAEEMSKQDVTDRLVIASDSWADSAQLLTADPRVVQGWLGVVPYAQQIADYDRYFATQRLADAILVNPWIPDFLETKFSCTYSNSEEYINFTKCTDILSDNLTLSDVQDDIFSFGKIPYILDAVYTVAQSLDYLLCKENSCDISRIRYTDLMKALKTLTFDGVQGDIIYDKNGDDVMSSYTVQTIASGTENTMRHEGVGRWINGTLTLNMDKIVAARAGRTISKCSKDCQNGTRRLFGSNSCCWSCVTCAKSYFTNKTNSETCSSCALMFGPSWTNNSAQSACIRLPTDFLKWEGFQSAIVLALCSIFLFFTLFSFSVFVKFRKTPIIKGSSKELLFVLLTMVALCFVLPVFYIGLPSELLCILQPNYLGFVFTMCVTIMLIKTRRILGVFNTKLTAPDSLRAEKKKNEHIQIALLIVITLTEVIIVGTSTYFLRPKLTSDYTEDDLEIIHCGENWLTLHVIAISCSGILLLICTALGFKARKLPSNFNEARFISFTAFMKCLIWIAMVPVYFGSSGALRTLFICFSVIFAASSILIFMIFPKIKIILFKPELNDAKAVRNEMTKHIMSNRSGINEAPLSGKHTLVQHKSSLSGSRKLQVSKKNVHDGDIDNKKLSLFVSCKIDSVNRDQESVLKLDLYETKL